MRLSSLPALLLTTLFAVESTSAAANTPAASADDLRALSTRFDRPEALSAWQEHRVPGFSPKWEAPKVEDGRLILQPHSSGWFEDMQAGHLYREVEGNFIVSARMRVDGTAAGTPQRSFSLAGLFVRAPRPQLTAAAWEPRKENWLFFSTGTAFPAGERHFEIKSTYNSLSTLKISPAPSGWITLRIARQGELFTLMHKADGAPQWTVLDQFIRPDLPARLNVGLTAYADWDSAAPVYPDFQRYNTALAPRNGDLVAAVDRVDFRRPVVDRFPIATLDPRVSFMPEVSSRRLADLMAD